MFADYVAFLRQHLRPVLFGALLTLLSSFGQTFFIALSAAGIRAEFALSDAALGTLYGSATLAAGLALGWVGRQIDRMRLPVYTGAVVATLAAGCVAMALANGLWALAAAYLALRLAGQGLTTHTAMTATARRFPRDAGKALGLVALGLVAGEAILPPGAVALVHGIGWRGLWWVAAALVAAGGIAALWLLAEPGSRPASPPAAAGAAPVPLWRDRAFLLMLPAALAPPFIMTGFFFNQLHLAEELQWNIGVLASAFALFAVVRAASMLLAGPVIDRAGAARLLPVFLLPLALAMAILILGRASHLATFAFMASAGLTNGVFSTLTTALATQLYGPARLAAVRAAFAAGTLVAAALAPAVFGTLLDAGVTLRGHAAACLVALLAASALTLPIAGRTSSPP